MCGYAHFTGQAIQVKFKGSLSGLELIRLHYDYVHFTGQAMQVRLERCEAMPTSRGKPYR